MEVVKQTNIVAPKVNLFLLLCCDQLLNNDRARAWQEITVTDDMGKALTAKAWVHYTEFRVRSTFALNLRIHWLSNPVLLGVARAKPTSARAAAPCLITWSVRFKHFEAADSRSRVFARALQGYTCQEFADYAKSRHCRYCATPMTARNTERGGPEALVCSAALPAACNRAD